MAEMTKLCRLWEKTSARGAAYLVGRMGDARVLIFKNTHKVDDGDHDYAIFLTAIEERQPQNQKASQPAPRPQKKVPTKAASKAAGKLHEPITEPCHDDDLSAILPLKEETTND